MRFLEDFRVGDRFSTPAVLLEEAAVIAFAREFDPQPFHVDPVAAQDSPFGGLVACGSHIAALSMKLMTSSELGSAGGLIGMGVEHIRWPRPSRPGDSLRGEVEVLEARPSDTRPGWGVLRLKMRMFNQHDDCVFESVPVCWVRAAPGG